MQLLKIGENDANQRLDKFLKKLFPNATRSLIYKLNRKNKIKILSFSNNDGKFRKKDNEYKLEEGDQIKIFLKDDEFKLLKKIRRKIIIGDDEKENNNYKFNSNNIVFEDEYLLVINKEPGINVHPGEYKTKESNIIAQIQDYLGKNINSLTFKPSLIHRIDRNTSGILMIAKKKDILVKLVQDFKEHKKIHKTYYAIVLGKLSRKEGTITKKILRIKNAKKENKVQISEKGLSAITHYKLLKEYKLKTNKEDLIISEIEVQIETGRMHQIRIHMSSIGNPILGDNTYGDKSLNHYLYKNYNLNRQALHAWKINFFHYGKNKKLNLEAPIKKDLKNFISKIKKQCI